MFKLKLIWESDDCNELRIVPQFGPVTKLQSLSPSRGTRSMANKAPKAVAAFILLDDQQVPVTLTGADAAGNPVPLPAGSVAWAVDNPAMLAITPSADTLSCLVQPMGPLGTATLSVVLSDASGTSIASGTLPITVTNGALTTIVVVPGTPVPLVPPTPPGPGPAPAMGPHARKP